MNPVILGFLLAVVMSGQRSSVKPPLFAVPFPPKGNSGGIFWAQTAFAGASALDVASSWGATELNPVLGRGRFGYRQTVISVGITAGVVWGGNAVVRKWPRSRMLVMYATLGAAGVSGWAASRTILQ